MTHTMIYFIMMLDNIAALLAISTAVFAGLFVVFLALLIGVGATLCENDIISKTPDYLSYAWLKKINKIVIMALCMFSFLYVLTPTTKQAFVIYALPKLANNQQLQQLQQLPDLAIKAVNEQLKKLASDKNDN